MIMKGDENLPIPAGFRILLKPREIQAKTSGGIILADTTKEWQKHATNISKVISMGPECYGEKEKYWCKIGDWVLTGKYVGSKFKYDNEDYTIINDDEVIAVVEKPEKISLK